MKNEIFEKVSILSTLLAMSACTTMAPGTDDDCSNGLCDITPFAPSSQYQPKINCDLSGYSNEKYVLCKLRPIKTDNTDAEPEFLENYTSRINISPLIGTKDLKFERRYDDAYGYYYAFSGYLSELGWEENSSVEISVTAKITSENPTPIYAEFRTQFVPQSGNLFDVEKDPFTQVSFDPVSISTYRIFVEQDASANYIDMNLEYSSIENSDELTVLSSEPISIQIPSGSQNPFSIEVAVPATTSAQKLQITSLNGKNLKTPFIVGEQPVIVVGEDSLREATEDELKF